MLRNGGQTQARVGTNSDPTKPTKSSIVGNVNTEEGTHVTETTATPGDAAAALAGLSSDEFAQAVQAALAIRAGSANAARAYVTMAALLYEDEQVGRLSGRPTDVIAHLESDRIAHLTIRSAAHRAVLDQPLLESSAVAEALGRGGTNSREAASKLRQDGRLLGIRQGNRYLFPAFQLDFVHRQVEPVVAQVNQILDAAGDPWGVASWWVTQSVRLDGRAPQDLIGGPDESHLLELARAELTD